MEQEGVDAQKDVYLYWQKRREQEAEDIRIAQELQKALEEEEKAAKRVLKLSQQNERVDKEDGGESELKRPKLSDSDYARKLQEEMEAEDRERENERKKQREAQLSDSAFARMLHEEEQRSSTQNRPQPQNSDAEMARKLYEDEQARLRAPADDFESHVAALKLQAEMEARTKLEQAQREREELERQLKALRARNAGGEGEYVPKVLHGIEFPDYWVPHTKSDYEIHEVYRDSPEWNEVASHFERTSGGLKVSKIERHQNRTLWMFYFLQRQAVAKKAGRKGHSEKRLFHGSSGDSYKIIMKDGFDHRVANLGGSIGAGTYFATHSSYSKDYTNASKLLYCRVTLGNIGKGQSGIRLPPAGCHSVANVHGDTGMYVVFDNQQAYPEYAIYYGAHGQYDDDGY